MDKNIDSVIKIRIKDGKCTDAGLRRAVGEEKVNSYTNHIKQKAVHALNGLNIGSDAFIYVSERKQHTLYIRSGKNLYTSNKPLRMFLSYTLVYEDEKLFPFGVSEFQLIDSIVDSVMKSFSISGQLYKKACSIIDGEVKPRTGPDRIPEVRKLLQFLNKRAGALAVGADGFAVKNQFIDPVHPDACLFYSADGTPDIIIQYKDGKASVCGGKYKKECDFLLSEEEPMAVRRFLSCLLEYGIQPCMDTRIYPYHDYKITIPTVFEIYQKYGMDVEDGIHAWMDKIQADARKKLEEEAAEKEWKKHAIKQIADTAACRDIYQFAYENEHSGIQATEHTILCELFGQESKNDAIMRHIKGRGAYDSGQKDFIIQCIHDMCRAGILRKRTMYALYGPHPMDEAEVMTKEVSGKLYMYCYTFVPAAESGWMFQYKKQD